MGLYIQIKEKNENSDFDSPLLYCHSDRARCEEIVNEWLKWLNNNPNIPKSTPLGRREAQTAIIDLLQPLTQYFFGTNSHITGMFRLIPPTKVHLDGISEDELLIITL